MRRATLPVLILLCGVAPSMAHAQSRESREHTQILADLRIVQEQQQRLQASVNALVEALKATNANVAAQTAESGRVFAGLKAEIDAVTSAIAPLRSLLDQTRIDVGRVGPELDALREALRTQLKYTAEIIQLLTPANPIGVDQPPGTTATPPAGGTPPANLPPANLPPSPAQFLNQANGYYASGDFESAIAAFEEFLKLAPDHSDAPFAQMQIGHAYVQLREYPKALDAFRVVTNKYSKSTEVPEAYYFMGTVYEKLPKQMSSAVQMYKLVATQYPKTTAGIRAAERLKSIK